MVALAVRHRLVSFLDNQRLWIIIAYFLLICSSALAWHSNQIRTQENRATLLRLCSAAGQLGDFWVGIRASVIQSLYDPTLTEQARKADQAFVAELTRGIHNARIVARCD